MCKLNQHATLWLLVFVASFFTTCQKDRIISDHTTENLSWTSKEATFFALQSSSSSIDFRNQSVPSALYHPLLLEARQELIQENEERPFVEAIVNHTGLPAWSKTYVYCQPTTKDKLVLIPLSSSEKSLVTGFITLYKKDDGTDTDFIINGMSRSELLDTTTGNPYQKAEYVKFMMKYDKLLFQKFDEKLLHAYCHYRSNTNNIPPSAMDPPPFTPPTFEGCSEAPAPSGLCEWRFLQVCTDPSTNYTWFGGTDGPLPSEIATWFDGDHDDDGILDQEDEDYVDWYWEFDDWWHSNYDLEWPDFFDGDHDNDGILDEFDLDWDAFYSGLEGQLNDLGTWFDDAWGDIDDWWEGLWDGEIGCPFEDPPLTGSADERTITCEWFYVLDCGAGAPGSNWYDTFVDVVPCPECPGYLEYHDMFRDRLYAHWLNNYGGESMDDFWGLYGLASSWSCNAYSPCFEECIDENFALEYFNAPPLPLTVLEFPNALNDCFLSTLDCPTCNYTATLYIEQPIPGTREVFNWTGQNFGSGKNAGHTFLNLSQYDPSISLIDPIRTLTFGFYPSTKPSGQEEVPGFFYKENDITVANISVTYNLTLSQYEEIKHQLSLYSNVYQVQRLNCSTIPVNVLQSAGFNIPITPREVFRLGLIEVNPADLGEDLRLNHPGGSFSSSPTYFHPPLSDCQ